MLETGYLTANMEMVNKLGEVSQLGQVINTKERWKKDSAMEKESIGMQMEIYTKDNGLKESEMEKVNSFNLI